MKSGKNWEEPALRELMRAGLEELGVKIGDDALALFLRYGREMARWNERVNLTAITAPEEVIRKHFLDALSAVPWLPPGRVRLVDVGSGAGLPGLALKIARPEIEVTLIESVKKKADFLRHAAEVLGLTGVEVRQERAEESGHVPELREAFTVATGRAVAALPVLAELALPLVVPGGLFIAFKGPAVEEEVKGAARALAVLGGKVENVIELVIPGGGERRTLVLVRKVAPTPAAYPRPTGRPSKKPL
ncbi:MAG: rRNA (guanine527-N7)-methyltransferase [Bacillota bacterium]|nr:rRNA (guanine527-N7)-methyltransferase [Bacillota bacterium]